jgi:hypothetical protein
MQNLMWATHTENSVTFVEGSGNTEALTWL